MKRDEKIEAMRKSLWLMVPALQVYTSGQYASVLVDLMANDLEQAMRLGPKPVRLQLTLSFEPFEMDYEIFKGSARMSTGGIFAPDQRK